MNRITGSSFMKSQAEGHHNKGKSRQTGQRPSWCPGLGVINNFPSVTTPPANVDIAIELNYETYKFEMLNSICYFKLFTCVSKF